MSDNSLNISDRLTRVEERSSYHEREIETLKSSQKETNEWLQRIQKTMDKIFWIASGCAITYLAKTFGISQVIKSFFL